MFTANIGTCQSGSSNELGLIGNAYILGRQIKDVKDDLRGQIHHLREDMKYMKDDIRDLTRRQIKLEFRVRARVEKLLMDCARNK